MPFTYVNIKSKELSSSYAPIYDQYITTQFLHIQRVGLTYCKSEYLIKNRHLDSHLICYIFKGEGTLNYRGQNIPLRKGSLFIIDCHEIHSYFPNQNDPFHLLFLHFYGSLSNDYIKIITKENFIYENPSFTHLIRNKIGQIYKKFSHHNNPNYYHLSTDIYDILMTFLNYTKEIKKQELFIPSDIQSAAKYIKENFTLNICIPDLAKQVSISEYHFIREFKKYMNQTPYEFILYCRFQHSKYLLLKTDMTVTEIANFLNFNSLSHYVSFFKKRESITPLQFRKRYSIIT